MNVFHSKPHQYSILTSIVSCVHGDNFSEIEVKENIVRPAGGGQPKDKATLTCSNREIKIIDVFKRDGKTWLRLSDFLSNDEILQQILINVDEAYRKKISKCHTMTHVAMASLNKVIYGFKSLGAEIFEDGSGADLLFSADEEISQDIVNQAEILSRCFINKNVDVTLEVIKPTNTETSVEIAQRKFPHWRINPNLNLSGRIRIVHVQGLDSNPCSGSHAKSTGEIGPFSFSKLGKSGDDYSLSIELSETWLKWFPEQAILRCDRIDLDILNIKA